MENAFPCDSSNQSNVQQSCAGAKKCPGLNLKQQLVCNLQKHGFGCLWKLNKIQYWGCLSVRSWELSISFPELRSPWPAVGKRELWEHPFWNNKENSRILNIRFHCAMRSLHLRYLCRMPEMYAPRALVFRPLVKGNEALGTRLENCSNVANHFQLASISKWSSAFSS